VKLRYVYRGNFRKNSVTLLKEALKEADNMKLGKNDCVLAVSISGKILRFMGAPQTLHRGGSDDATYVTEVQQSLDYRVTGDGVWNPLMLQNYAAELGMELEGLKRFEDHYKEMMSHGR